MSVVRSTRARLPAVAALTLSPVAITMASGSTVKARPSALTNGQDFSIAWHHS